MELKMHSTTLREAIKNGDMEFLRLYLNTPCTAKVETRIVELCLESGHPNVMELFLARKNTHPNIAQVALSWSITYAQTQWMKNFVTWDRALENTEQMLMLAIKSKNTHAIDILLPYISSVSSEILCAAVRTSNTNIVQKILPLCNPQEQSSSGLQEAVAFQNQEIFDILYPLSDPNEAWECIRKDSWFDANQRRMIKSRLDMDRQKLKFEKAAKGQLHISKAKKM